MKMKVKRNFILIGAVISILGLTLSTNINPTYKADNQPTDTTYTTPSGYMFLSSYIDAYPSGIDPSTNSYYYAYGDGNLVYDKTSKGSLANLSGWKDAVFTHNRITIPKTVGSYEVDGVEWVKPFNTGIMFEPAGRVLEYTEVQTLSKEVSLQPQVVPFDNNLGIIITGVAPNGAAYCQQLTDSELHKNKYIYAADQYSFSNIQQNGDKVSMTVRTNWRVQPNLDNDRSTRPWTSTKDLSPMMTDANIIQRLCLYKLGFDNMRQTAKYLLQNPYVHATLPDGTIIKSPTTGTYSYSTWREYWGSYIVGADAEALYKDIWLGNPIPASSNPTIRIYQPFIVKLRLKGNGPDLELLDTAKDSKGSCDAYISGDYLMIKTVGNLCAGSENEVISDLVKITVKDNNTNLVNNVTCTTEHRDLKLNEPVDYFGNGSHVTIASSNIKGEILYKDSYMAIPIDTTKPADGSPHTITITQYINPDHSPTEMSYDNNKWERTLTIPETGDGPDLIAKHIAHTAPNIKMNQRATLTVQLTTLDKDFENILSYVDSHKGSRVTVSVTVDGTQVLNKSYNHMFLENTVVKEFTFTTPYFTPSNPTKKVRVELTINGDHTNPENEVTFTNNKKTEEFTLVAIPDMLEPDKYPSPPKFTNMVDCIFLDKDNPNTASKILYSMGTFITEQKVSNPQSTGFPISSEIQWVAGNSAIPKLNWGELKGISWEPVFPNKGKNGWVTTSDDDTSGCSYCGYDPTAYDMYRKFVEDYQCTTSFVHWDKVKFQQSNGTVFAEVNGTNVNLYRIVSRSVANPIACGSSTCCNGCTSCNANPYSSTSLHAHETKTSNGSHSSSCLPDCTSSHSYSYRVCKGKSPTHYHSHTEYRLEYAAKFQLGYNVKLTNPTVKTVDYATGDKVTRAGYGISTNITNIGYITDYKDPTVKGQYGEFKVQNFESKAVVKTPAKNTVKPFLVSELEPTVQGRPFAKKYTNIPNAKSPLGYREVFIDVDYPDGDFPVYYTVMYMPFSFQPPSREYMTNKEQQLYDRYGSQLTGALGFCFDDKIQIKGNMWNDSWTHPVE